MVAVVNEQNCIHCGLCQISCPTKSIAVKHGVIEAIRIAIRHAKRTSL